MWTKLFETANDVGVKVTYKKNPLGEVELSNAQWGVCAAMSALWLKNMFTQSETDARPDKFKSGILYGKWANRQDASGLSAEQFNRYLVENAGMKILSLETLAHADAVNKMSTTPGSYYLSTTIHAMAAINRSSGYYFFDPNSGSFKTGDVSDFRGIDAFITNTYGGLSGYSANWLMLTVAEED